MLLVKPDNGPRICEYQVAPRDDLDLALYADLEMVLSFLVNVHL